MKEYELNALLGVIQDPINNVYNLKSYKDSYEIERMIRIFNMAKEQKNKHRMLSIRNIATLKIVLSNN